MPDAELIPTILTEVVSRIIDLLPSLLAALVVVVVGWFASRVLYWLTRGLLRRVGLDEAIGRTVLAEGMQRAGIRRPASELLGLIVFWLVFLSFVLITLEQLGFAVAVQPLQELIRYLPRLLAASGILIVGALLAQGLDRAVQAAASSLGVEFHQTLGRIAGGLTLVISAVVAVQQLGFDVTLLTGLLTNLLTIAAAALALALGLGARDVARSVLAGYYARETYELGGRVVIEEVEGTLEAIGTLNAEVSVGEDRLVIPNSRLTGGIVRVRGSGGSSEHKD